MTIRIRFQHTRFPHWGARSGYSQLIRHLDPARLDVQADASGDDDQGLPGVPAALRPPLRRLARRGMPWYKLSDLAAELRVLRGSLAGRHDIVHFLDGEHAPQYLPLLPMPRRRPALIATYHQPPSMLANLVRRDVVSRLDHVVVMAPSQLQFFHGIVPDGRLHLLLHGVDTGFFSPRQVRQERVGLRCVTAGYWLRDWDTVRAVTRALRDVPDIRFDVVTRSRDVLAEAANVAVHVGLDDHRLAELYRSADVLFLPLLDATANNTLLEGMASGLAVVASDLEPVRAYLPAGAGILVAGGDVESYVAALRRLRDDPDLRRRLGAAARHRAEALSWPAVAEQHAALYERVARARGVAQLTSGYARPPKEAGAVDDDLITVVIPANNAAGFLPRTLASALAQTHARIEVLVVDDGSTDATAGLVETVAAADARVRLIRQANAGVAAARNRGIAEARGALVAVLDADDVWHPLKLEKQLAHMRAAGPATVLVSCWRCKIDSRDRVIRAGPPADERKEPSLRALLRSNLVCASAPLMRADAVRAVGGYDPSLRARGAEGVEDLKLYLQLALRHRLGVVPEVLVAYRETPGSMSRRILEMWRSHRLVLDDIEACAPRLPKGWLARGRCRAGLDATARLLATGRPREALGAVLGLTRRHPGALLRELLSAHAIGYPVRRLLHRRRRPGRLDWVAEHPVVAAHPDRLGPGAVRNERGGCAPALP